jgi:gamma-glutamyl-gamma-aminobutyrate hydrolase PuuD
MEIVNSEVMPITAPKERKVLQTTLGKDAGNNRTVWINSWHHQGVEFDKKKFNKGEYHSLHIDIVGTAPIGKNDNSQVIEMMIGTKPENFWISTQFHPEADWEENSVSHHVMELFAKILEEKK